MDPKGNQIDALHPNNFSAQNLASAEIPDLRGQTRTCGEFWNTEIAPYINGAKAALQANLQAKNPTINTSTMAEAISHVSGLDANATLALGTIQEASFNIATNAVVMRAFSKAGTGLSGIDLSNEMVAQQSLVANMIDSTGQFKWMIRVIPVLEFLILGILLFLAIPMGVVAGLMGAEKGGKMLMNYSFGLIAFSFVDVALAVVQAISLYYYGNKMAETVLMLGGVNPYTANGIPIYLQEMGYMSGMMGLAAVIVVPLVVGVVFKGETMAAAGAYNSVMGKYKGDAGGQTALGSAQTASAIQAQEAVNERERENSARRELEGGYGITSIPRGVLASKYLDQISAEVAALGTSSGHMRVMDSEYGGDFEKFSQDRGRAGVGSGITSLTSEIGTGLKNLELTNNNPHLSIGNQIEAAKGTAEQNLRKTVGSGLGAKDAFSKAGVGDNFQYQAQTDSEVSITSQAAKGKGSKEIDSLSRDNQVIAANALAVKGMEDQVGAGLGLLKTGAFDANGNAIAGALTEATIKGAALGNLQKANSQIGTGQTGDYTDYAEVALEDGKIAGKAMNKTNTRRNQLDGKNGTEKWDEDKIADGQAIQATQGQIKTQGASNSLTKEGQKNDDAFRQAAMGSEFTGRKEENDLLGIGAKWTQLTNHNADDIKLMKKEQANAAVSAIGGIESAYAAIDAQGGVDASIKTGAAAASLKAKQQQEGLKGSMESYLQSKEGGGHSKEAAASLAKGILDGGVQAAEAMKSVLASAGNLAFTQSSVKTGGDLSTVAGYHESGMVDQEGGLTKNAKEAMERKETTSGAEMLSKGAFMGEENKETLQAINAKTINQLGRTAEERKKVAQNMQKMGFLQNADDISFDENGNAIASSITPTYGNQLAKAVGTAQGGKLGENLKAMIINGAEVKNAGESVSAVKNNQYAETTGSKFDAGWKGEHIQKDIKGAAASEAAEFGMSPKEWVKGIAAMGHDKGVEALKGLGFDDQKAENLYNTITSPAVGVAGAIALAEVTSRISGKGSLVGKTWEAAEKAYNKLTGKPTKSVLDESSDKPHHKDGSESNSKVNNESNHDKSPNSDKDNISNNSKSVNSEKGFSQGKTTNSGIHVPDGFDLSEPHTAKPKSWAGKIQDAMSGSGNFRTKLSIAAGTMALGYGVDAQAREISPSSVSNAAKAIPREEEGFLKQASDTLGNMELVGGLTTLAAEGASKFSSIAKGVAKSVASVGAKTMPGIGMAFGAADGAYRASEGDTLGAAMSAGIAAASTLPVVGTGVALAGSLAQIATDAMGITGTHKSAAPQHQGFMSQPMGYHTNQAIQEQAMQSQVSMANNIQTLTGLTESRTAVGFTMQDADKNSVKFTTDKQSHNVMMNGQDTGVGYKQFSSMMQNPESVSQFANAISQSSFSNAEVYSTTNNILSDMNNQNARAIMQQKVHNNASDTNRAMQHKEMLETNKQSQEKEYEF